ncbi:hypothetical protein NDU88_004605 [Pleurodeles waltl]|uniref:Uncharacterized protein n=1 Tax=Pleurodeles waltl TaxID=8319 RepID=A0AAV7M8N8_PLEWA|nr:hypothetical protein NDU88_004605 [Pleurodeles waltl]
MRRGLKGRANQCELSTRVPRHKFHTASGHPAAIGTLALLEGQRVNRRRYASIRVPECRELYFLHSGARMPGGCYSNRRPHKALQVTHAPLGAIDVTELGPIIGSGARKLEWRKKVNLSTFSPITPSDWVEARGPAICILLTDGDLEISCLSYVCFCV